MVIVNCYVFFPGRRVCSTRPADGQCHRIYTGGYVLMAGQITICAGVSVAQFPEAAGVIPGRKVCKGDQKRGIAAGGRSTKVGPNRFVDGYVIRTG